MSLPATQKAAVLNEIGKDLVVETIETYKPGPGEILIRVESTALNPVDWVMQAIGFHVEKFPTILGTDSAGVVVALGEGVTNFAVGDKVLHQGYFAPRQATFQQYIAYPAEIVAKIPPNITFDEAATISLCLGTAAIGLYQKQFERGGAGLTPPWEAGGEGKYAGVPIVVLGGSSSVGQYTIQLAKLSGFSPIITTASPRNFELVKSLGATHVLDRNLPISTLPEAVKSITSKPITIVYNTIAEVENLIAAQSLVTDDGVIATVFGDTNMIPEEQRANPPKKFILTYGLVFAPANRELGKSLYSKLTDWLATGAIKPNPVNYVPGGLGAIQDQLNRLKRGEISGQKIVLRPTESL